MDSAAISARLPPPQAALGGVQMIKFCLAILTVIAVGATAYFAREFLIPIAVALLLATMTSPIARVLERMKLPSTVASGLIVGFILATLVGLSLLALPQIVNFAREAPDTIRTIEKKVSAAQDTFAGLKRAAGEIQDATKQAGVTPQRSPITVQQSTPLTRAITGTAKFVGQTVAALLLTFFLLAQRRRMKTIAVAMAQDYSTRKRLIVMFEDIKARISTYLLSISLTSCALGAASATGLFLLGFPNPLVWGILVTLFNFVPFAGPAVVQVGALIFGALLYPTVPQAVAPALMLWALNFIEGQFVTPHFVARKVVINPLAVVLAVIFGGWIWGIAGAILAVPGLILAASIVQHWWAPCATDASQTGLIQQADEWGRTWPLSPEDMRELPEKIV